MQPRSYGATPGEDGNVLGTTGVFKNIVHDPAEGMRCQESKFESF